MRAVSAVFDRRPAGWEVAQELLHGVPSVPTYGVSDGWLQLTARGRARSCVNHRPQMVHPQLP